VVCDTCDNRDGYEDGSYDDEDSGHLIKTVQRNMPCAKCEP
jgi:hypothetical protein